MQDKFGSTGFSAKQRMEGERLQFFKSSHFNIGTSEKDKRQISDQTVTKASLPAYSGSVKASPNDCSAFQIRHGRVQVGSPDPKHPTSFVSSGQIQQRWIQPQYN